MDNLQYSTIEDLLAPLRLPVSTSEIHGLLVGYLAAGGSERSEWLVNAGLTAADGSAVPADIVDMLYSASETGLRATDFSFTLLLPGDDAPLQARLDALIDWCRGFLGGFGLSGNAAAGLADSADAQEVLRDFGDIASANVEPDDDGEQNENALAELQEYVRVGAILLDANGRDDGTTEHADG